MKKWSAFVAENNDIFVIPLDDIREHSRYDCPCGPKTEIYGERLLVIHNSFDEREVIEGAVEYIKSLND